MSEGTKYPPIEDYAFISDCHSAALISRDGSVDWLCMPRLDSGSYFGRLLDWERGGYCSISPEEGSVSYRQYVEDSLVLETIFESGGGEARLFDCLVIREGGRGDPPHQLLRVVEGVRGRVDFRFDCAPVFDYGEVSPWIRQQGPGRYSAVGGDDGLLVSSPDTGISPSGHHELSASFTVRAGQRVRFSLEHVPPEVLDYDPPQELTPGELDGRLEKTLELWEKWASRARGVEDPGVLQSALVLRGLVHSPTGAIAAAPTTSLPEVPGGSMNWDYRYSWVRDSFFSVGALAEIGFEKEADGFRRFVERTSAGSAEEVKVAFGLGGERRLTEVQLGLEGYRRSTPVRVGNAASGQLQLDMYGELLELSWLWHLRGHSSDDHYWRFLLDLVDTAAERWGEPDRGFWEVRGDPQHFVRSKVMCWVALDRGIRLAEDSLRQAPTERWKQVRDEIRDAVETKGYDRERGIFVRSFDSEELDAVLLLLPRVGFVDYDDERMVRTTDAIRDELDDNGLIRRFLTDSGEGAFLACSFWLVECLLYQERVEEARETFDRAVSTGNDLGLFSEEYDTRNDTMLGNFPQALTHLAHISAARSLAEREPPR